MLLIIALIGFLTGFIPLKALCGLAVVGWVLNCIPA